MNLVSKQILKLFDCHMVLNKKDKVLLESWGVKNVYFIPSGVRAEKFLKLKEVASALRVSEKTVLRYIHFRNLGLKH